MALGFLYNTGQDCTAGSRVYVQESIYDKFIQILIEKAKSLTIGNGLEESSGGGPVVSITDFCDLSPSRVPFCHRENAAMLKTYLIPEWSITDLPPTPSLRLFHDPLKVREAGNVNSDPGIPQRTRVLLARRKRCDIRKQGFLLRPVPLLRDLPTWVTAIKI